MVALYMFRQGIRESSSPLSMAGRIILGELCYSTNMTNYMDILFRDLVTRVKAPPSVLAAIQQNESFSKSHQPLRCERGDFILAGRNRRTKMPCRPGVQTQMQWID